MIEHDHRRFASGARENDPEVTPAPAAVDRHHHHQRAKGTDAGDFGGRRPAAVERDHDDDDEPEEGRQPRQRLQAILPAVILESEQRVGTGGLNIGPRRTLFSRRFVHHPDCEQHRKQQTRPDACHEQFADRLLGGEAVQDQRQRRRNQDAECAAGGDQAGGECVRVAALPHFRNARGPNRRAGRGARAAHRREHRAGEGVGQSETTRHLVQPAIQRVVEVCAGA